MNEAIFSDWGHLEQTPLADTSDGSTDWFDMRHEEGLAVDRWGHIVQHVVAGDDRERIIFSAAAVRAAVDGGILMHSHPWPGASFSAADLAALTISPSAQGMALVVTTSHPIGGVMRRVRYILDMRERLAPRHMPGQDEIADVWDREFVKAGVELYREDTGSLGADEGYADYIHRVMEGVSRCLGLAYRQEVVE